MRRHSTGMMVTGITMLVLAPVAALVSAIARGARSTCNLRDAADPDAGFEYGENCKQYDGTIFAFDIGSIVLLGAGIPLTIVGARSEPVPVGEEAMLSPWVSPTGGGSTLRLRW
jgi:hypothetical protein